MDFAGEFETHLTIALDSATRLETLWEWANARGLKCLHILLDRGFNTSQPMLSRRGSGNLPGEFQVAHNLCEQLATCGFHVARIKIEAACTNRNVPATDADAAVHPERYFEHHVKLLVDSQTDVTALANLAQDHSAHLSRNALRTRNDGRQERFVTQRCRLVGRDVARRRLDALLEGLESHGHQSIDVEEEFVVFDSHEVFDAGWIDDS